MKKSILLISLVLCFSLHLISQESLSNRIKLHKTQGTPFATLLNINNISAWYSNSGEMEINPITMDAGVTYPKGTATAISCSGIMIGGYVNDGVPRLFVSGSQYLSGFRPGAILGMKTGMFEVSDSADTRIWRVRRDYATADLLQDASEYYMKSKATTYPNDISQLRLQYKKDWIEWPTTKGAPYRDADGDGKYTPKFAIQNGTEVPLVYPAADEPGIAGADQVIWYVANDIAAGDSPWKTKPVGLEMQTTIWGYNDPSNTGLGNAVFKRSRYIFKGTANSTDTARLTKLYLGQWFDPGLGNTGDDFVGCDTVLETGYVFNSKTLDTEYRKYNISAPALGYVQLQGPCASANNEQFAEFNWNWKKGFVNIPMKSFWYYATGGSNPTSDAVQWYQILRGLPHFPAGPPDPALFTNPVTGKSTRYCLSGDPVLGIGWIDGTDEPLGGRKGLLSAGPFEMALGDTQEVVYALVGGLGSDRLASVSVIKLFVKQNRASFSYLFPDNPNGVVRDKMIPAGFVFEQNYPNPFNPTTIINYALPGEGWVSIKIYDALGRGVKTLVDEHKQSGHYTASFDAGGLASGLYIYELISGKIHVAKKMLLIR